MTPDILSPELRGSCHYRHQTSLRFHGTAKTKLPKCDSVHWPKARPTDEWGSILFGRLLRRIETDELIFLALNVPRAVFSNLKFLEEWFNYYVDWPSMSLR
ncbi:hypothetical protein CBL_05908 [Carabus blaptoides fortunei]